MASPVALRVASEETQIGPTWESDCGTVKLWLGDCLDVMQSWPDGAVDAVVTDPPYGVGFAAWDSERPIDAWFHQLRRISPSSAVHSVQGEIWKWPQPDWIMAWFMPGSVNRTKRGKFRHWEPVLVYGEERAQVDSRVFPPIGAKRNGHPCPKPLPIANWLVDAFSNEGELIGDPFLGSGTTGVAAVRLGRQFWGVEIDEEYFEIAKRRIKDELRRMEFLEPQRVKEKHGELFS